MNTTNSKDHSAAFADAFFIANLLFVGAFYIALWVLFATRYTQADAVSRSHIKQALVGASISTGIFAIINISIILTTGYASGSALLLLEVYFMVIVPLFLVVGILAFSKAIKGEYFCYPLIGRMLPNPSPACKKRS